MRQATGAFIVHRKKLLMLLRDNNPAIPDPDCWQLIGGQVEVGETPKEALIREIEEEVNLRITPEEVSFVEKAIIPKATEYFLYRIEISDKQAAIVSLGDEGQAIQFFSFKEMIELKMGKYFGRYCQNNSETIKGLIDGEHLGNIKLSSKLGDL